MLPAPPVELQAWAQFVGITAGAVLGVGGVATGLYRLTIGRQLAALRSDVASIKHEVEPNGSDGLLPEEERGMRMRTLVIKSRLDIGRIDGRLEDGEARFDRLEQGRQP